MVSDGEVYSTISCLVRLHALYDYRLVVAYDVATITESSAFVVCRLDPFVDFLHDVRCARGKLFQFLFPADLSADRVSVVSIQSVEDGPLQAWLQMPACELGRFRAAVDEFVYGDAPDVRLEYY